jgi:hypothetical protein
MEGVIELLELVGELGVARLEVADRQRAEGRPGALVVRRQAAAVVRAMKASWSATRCSTGARGRSN